jgi:hypothetical protein
MLALVIAGAVVAGLAVAIASDPEYVQQIKEIIFLLVKAGYDETKIMQIMHVYLYL